MVTANLNQSLSPHSGMVLCASNDDHTKVEPLRVPEGCVPGERISFEGIAGEAG